MKDPEQWGSEQEKMCEKQRQLSLEGLTKHQFTRKLYIMFFWGFFLGICRLLVDSETLDDG